MIVKENVTVYKCEFCNKKMFVKKAMENHITYCSKNPENFKKCFEGCIHLEETSIEYVMEYHGRSESETKSVRGFKCTLLDKLLYPTIVERKGLLDKYPGTFDNQEPMPKECKEFDDGDKYCKSIL